MKEISLLEMLKCGVHFGHQKSRWHPKMKPFIYTERSGVHIIDLEKTRDLLIKTMDFVETIASRGGVILFIGTKKQAQTIIKNAATKCQMPYIINRWIGGLFTNFTVVKRLINKLTDLRRQQKSGELEKYTKKEKVSFLKKMSKLDGLVGGITELNKIPDAIFLVDMKIEKTALTEAKKKKIPIIAMLDTNCDPTGIKYPIPANDDATKSIEFITNCIAEKVIEGRDKVKIEAKELKGSNLNNKKQ